MRARLKTQSYLLFHQDLIQVQNYNHSQKMLLVEPDITN